MKTKFKFDQFQFLQFPRALFVCGLLAFAVPAAVQGQNWNGNTDTFWGTAANWTGTAPVSSGSLALVFDTGNLTGLGIHATENNLTSFTANGITFTGNAGGPFTLTGNAITLSNTILVNTSAGSPGPLLDLNIALGVGSNRTVQVNSGAAATISGVTSGTIELRKRGSGTLTLSGNNTFSGGLQIGLNSGVGESNVGGTVILKHNNAAGTGAISVYSIAGRGALLLADGLTIANAISATGNNEKIIGLESRATNATLSGNLTGGANNLANLRALNGQTLHLTGNIATGGFRTAGAGTVVVSGQTNAPNSAVAAYLGTLRLDYSTNNTTKLIGATQLALSGGTLELSGGGQTETLSGQMVLYSGASRIVRTSGSSTLNMTSASSPSATAGSTLDISTNGLLTVTAGSIIGTTSAGVVTLNGTDWAVTAGTGAGQAVIAMTSYTDLANGGNLTNTATPIRLLGGTVGLAPASVGLNTLVLQNNTATTINTGTGNLTTRGIMIAKGGGNLTVGANVGDGNLIVSGAIFNYSSTSKLLVNAHVLNGLTKSGEGLVELAANNTYTGTTFANEGTLLISGGQTGNGAYEVRGELAVNASIGTGAVTVYDGGLLSGTGTINGATTLQQGAKLSAGDNSANTLTFTNGLDISATADMTGRFLFTLGSTSDQIAITGGTLTIGAGVMDFGSFAFTAGPGFAAGNYTLFDSTNALSGSLALGNLTGTIDGKASTLSISGNDVILTVVPEPGVSLLLFGGGLALLLQARNRRRS